MQRAHASRGFTIVELAIVMSVIAILSVIAVVAYSQLSERGNAARAASAAAQYVTLLKLYKAEFKTYPISDSDDNPSGGETCLGERSIYTATTPFSAGQCVFNHVDSYRVDASTVLSTALKKYGAMPNTVLPTNRVGNESWRGFRYTYFGSYVWIEWTIKGNHTDWCGEGKGVLYGSYTWCTIEL